MSRFPFGSGTENRRNVVILLDVGFLSKIQVAAICLRLARQQEMIV